MKFNIIIPSIQLSNELKYTLKKLENLKYKNFFVTIVLDKKNFIKNPKYKYKLKILIVGKKSMSFKRNIAAKKFKTDYLAFLDSDAYPNSNWLKNAKKLLNNKKIDAIGGPSIPFPKQKLSELISYYAKRSYFVTGYLNFRKYLSEDRFCEWLESCNLIISKKKFLKYGGMDEKKYLGEDKNFFHNIYKLNPNFKTFFSKKLFIYHKEREFKKFLVQRFSFGTDLINILGFGSSYKSYQPLLPLITLISFCLLIFFGLKDNFYLILMISVLSFMQLIIILNLNTYLKNIKLILLSLCVVNFANLSFALGSVFGIFNFSSKLIRKIYLSSRLND